MPKKCNATNCENDFNKSEPWKHRFNNRFYCDEHAEKINRENMYWDGKELCEMITWNEKNNIKNVITKEPK